MSAEPAAKLFDPITIAELTFRNRLWVAPMCQYRADEGKGTANDWHLIHYGALAKGGAGAIITEAAAIRADGRISNHDLGLWNQEQATKLQPITDFAHRAGTKIGVQLSHAGRKASSTTDFDGRNSYLEPASGGWELIAPSAVGFPGRPVPRALNVAEIAELVGDFAASAKLAVAAGFDFVELHAAHGYLIHEFLSPLSNLRSDGYGGSLRNRCRFLLEIVKACREHLPPHVPIFVRISATDWSEGGLDLDQSIELASLLKSAGVSLIDVSSGGNTTAPPPVIGPGYQLRLAQKIKDEAEVPVAAVGLITTPEQAAQLVLSEQADVALVGREFLRDPHFGLRAAALITRRSPEAAPDSYRRAY